MRRQTIVLTIVFLLAGGAFAYVLGNIGTLSQYISPFMTKEEGREQIIPVGFPKPGSEVEVIARNPIWKHYADAKLGIEFDYPDKTVRYDGCDDKFVDVVPQTDQEQSFVFLGYSHTFNKDCLPEPFTLDIIRGLEDNVMPWYGWKIDVLSVKDQSELEKYIQMRFGTACKPSGLNPSSQEGTYHVYIVGDGLDPDSTRCPVNYAVSIVYSPDRQKIAVWIFGQEPQFWVSTDARKSVDSQIVESFRFMD